MVRVVRLERTVSWSQTRRDTNFAIPGYSLFCHDTTASGKNKDFSVCGHSCGQSRFYGTFGNRGKSRKCRCHKAFRRFASPYPGYNHGTPKSRALPTALHPDIQFFCMIPREEGKSKFLVSVGGAVVKPKIAGVFQAGNFRRRLLSQRLPGSRFQGNGWGVYPPKASALPTALHPDILLECSTLLLSQLFYYNI